MLKGIRGKTPAGKDFKAAEKVPRREE